MSVSAVLRYQGRILAMETANDENAAGLLAMWMRDAVQVEVVAERTGANHLPRHLVHILVDELREGKLYKRCGCCGKVKEINDFGLQEWSWQDGPIVYSVFSWCRPCRPGASPEPDHYIQMRADELREGRLHKKCPRCSGVKEVNAFGLRRKMGAGRNGLDVFAVQAWCRPCRPSGGMSLGPEPDTEEK